MRIILYDEQEVVRLGLTSFFGSKREFDIVAIAPTIQRGLKDAAVKGADAFVCGLRAGCSDQLEAIKRFGIDSGRCGVLAFAQELKDASMALHHGARGFVLKSDPLFLLEDGVREVARGGFFLSPALIAKHYSEEARRNVQDEKMAILTRRESEILKALALGSSNKEIASTFGISPRTAEGHRSHIIRKLGIRSAPHLAIYALEHGLIDA